MTTVREMINIPATNNIIAIRRANISSTAFNKAEILGSEKNCAVIPVTVIASRHIISSVITGKNIILRATTP